MKGLEGNVLVGSSLVDMYAKCGILSSAQNVFDSLPLQARDVVSWNSLIVGYLDHGMGEEALRSFKRMQMQGICPDDVIFVCVLKACGILTALESGQSVYGEITMKGLEKDQLVGNAVVDFYAKCSMIEAARKVFCNHLDRTIIAWNSLLAYFAENQCGKEALVCLTQMQTEGIVPDSITFICALKACTSVGSVLDGYKLHGEIAKKGIDGDPILSSTMVDTYAKCGLSIEAQSVFDSMTNRDEVTWNALITGYVEQGYNEEALACMRKMEEEGISTQSVTFISGLKGCGSTAELLEAGQGLHAEIVMKGLEGDTIICSSLVDMYAKHGLMTDAWLVSRGLKVTDVILWNTLLVGYINHGFSEQSLLHFEQMRCGGVSPDATSFICSLKACNDLKAIDEGQEMYSELVKCGYDRDDYVGNTLVDMFVNWGLFTSALKVFGALSHRSVISWNLLITGYTERNCRKEALDCFKQMQLEGVCADKITFFCTLKACACTGLENTGHEIHAEIAMKGFDTDTLVGNSLVDMYCKCSMLEEGQYVFKHLSAHNVVSWNALLVEQECNEDILECIEQMRQEDVALDEVTYLCCLRTLGDIGNASKVQQIHSEVAQRGLDSDSFVCNMLVDAYSKCSLVMEKQCLFDKLSVKTVHSWSAIIAGYSDIGKHDNPLYILNQMIAQDTQPNPVTFVSILNMCTHLGLVVEGHVCFNAMLEVFEITPCPQHYACMVDLFGRAGLVDTAICIIQHMPFPPCSIVLHTIMGACTRQECVQLGRQAFDYALQLDERDVAAYVCMSNIYIDN
jgi:pentatricopeptide repeat protein